MIRARGAVLFRMKLQHIFPLSQILDNEISTAYKEEIRHTGMTYQLVPPDDHRRNLAERAIRTWKNHFVRVLSGTSSTSPLHLWCRIIPQAERQLLLLSHSNVNTHISYYAHVYGQHDYSAEPFVPISTEYLVHDKPQRRQTFAEHYKKKVSCWERPLSTTGDGKCG